MNVQKLLYLHLTMMSLWHVCDNLIIIALLLKRNKKCNY